MKTRAMFVLLVLLATMAAQGQDLFTQALDREFSAARAGISTVNSPGADASDRDYDSLLLAALESLFDSKGQTVTFEHNFDVPVFGADHRFKAQAVLRKPTALGPTTLKEVSDTTRRTQLLDELTHSDDVTVTLSVSPFAAKKKNEVKRQFSALFTNMANRNALLTLAAPGFVNTKANPLEAQREALRAIEPLLEAVALEATAESKLTVDASYHSRSEIVGPTELMIKARYEFGSKNALQARIEALGKTNATCDGSDVARLLTMSVCYKDVMTVAENLVARDTRRKFVAAIEYHDMETINFTIPGVTNPIKADGASSFVWSISGGYDIYRPAESTDRRGRIDLEIKYDDVSKDPNRKDRFIGSLTYTQKLTEKVQIPISLVYANHDDYLTNVDRKLNAHFGLSYKLPGM